MSKAAEKPYSVLVRDLPCHRRFEVGPARIGEWLRGLPMRDALGAPEGDPEAGQGVDDRGLGAGNVADHEAHIRRTPAQVQSKDI